MAKHNVTFSIPKRQLGNLDIKFDVYEDEIKLGTLRISKGDMEWSPSKSKRAIKLSWTQFDHRMKKRK